MNAFGCKFCDWDKKTNKRKVKQKFRIVKVTPLMMMFVTHISYKYSSVLTSSMLQNSISFSNCLNKA